MDYPLSETFDLTYIIDQRDQKRQNGKETLGERTRARRPRENSIRGEESCRENSLALYIFLSYTQRGREREREREESPAIGSTFFHLQFVVIGCFLCFEMHNFEEATLIESALGCWRLR